MKRTALLTIVLAAVCCGCTTDEKRGRPDVTTYDVRGVVVEVDPDRLRIVLDHEEIPGYMMAMTMPFRVNDSTLLLHVQPGDTVIGTLAVTSKKSWLETVFVIGRGGRTAPAARGNALTRVALRPGDRFPDFGFVNQDGRRVHMHELDGRVVALTFIYTRCPLPDFCIQMTSAFAKVQQELAGNRSLRGQWHLLTVSFDPTYDTPSILRNYGKAYGADFATWDFVTESPEVVLQIAGAVGLVVHNEGGEEIIHNLRTVVLDRERRVAQIFEGNEWEPSDLVNAMKRAAAD
jgi:protein SCO1/2